MSKAAVATDPGRSSLLSPEIRNVPVSFASPLVFLTGYLLMLATMAQGQTSACPMPTNADVTTWHNDICRTGWQSHENVLTPVPATPGYVSQTSFGLLWQWTGFNGLAAQPLAVGALPTVNTCHSPCNLIFIATEDDNIYAYNADSDSQTPVWTAPLAADVGGTYVDCTTQVIDFGPCSPAADGGNTSGVTGTPVIDENTKILYAAAAVSLPGGSVAYYLFARYTERERSWVSPYQRNRNWQVSGTK